MGLYIINHVNNFATEIHIFWYLSVLVQPSLFLSSENTLWYSWMRSHMHCDISCGHSFRASKFSSFSTLACLSNLVNDFLVIPCSSSNASGVLGQRLVFGILFGPMQHCLLCSGWCLNLSYFLVLLVKICSLSWGWYTWWTLPVHLVIYCS